MTTGYIYTTLSEAESAQQELNAYFGIGLPGNTTTQWASVEYSEIDNFWYIVYDDMYPLLGVPQILNFTTGTTQ